MAAKRIVIVRIAISVSTAFATVLALGAIVGLRLNLASNSLPPGIYRIAPRGMGSDLLICPTEIAESISISRGYRPKGAGCGDGYAPLLKPISARYGDTVTVSSAGSPSMAGCCPTQSNTQETHSAGHCLKCQQGSTRSCREPSG